MLTVLWIDDQYAEQTSFIDLAKIKYNIDIKPFDLRKEGIEELEKNLRVYDAVILDAKMLNESKNENPSTRGLFLSINKLNELKGKNKYIPFVIYTAQPDLLSDQEFNNSTIGIDKYKKGIDNDRMLNDIIKIVADRVSTKIKIKYQPAFNLCTNNYIGDGCSKKLISLLLIVENQTEDINTEDMMTAIRKIIEKIFEKFNSIGIIPDEVYKSVGYLNKSKSFLLGEHIEYIYKKQILDPVIASHLVNILEISQDASHYRNNLKLNIDSFIQKQGTPYLFCSTIFQLLDVMVWCKSFFDQNTDMDANRKLWDRALIEGQIYFEGAIEQDENNNYFCGEYILSYNHIINNNYKVGDLIKIISAIDNSKESTSRMYPKRAMKFIKLDMT